jgi:hypothetical protein
MSSAFSPREIVSELDRFIVGQDDAKRAVAIALRNRWRRQQLPESWPGWRKRPFSRSRRPNSPKSAMSAATSSRSCAIWSRTPF